MNAGTNRAFRARRVIVAGTDRSSGAVDGGFVVVRGERVVDVVTHAPDCEVTDLGSVVLGPGLINAHTHLELSSAPAILAPRAFSDFLWAMRDHRRSIGDEDLAAAAAAGAGASVRAGTTAVMDLATCAGSARALAASPLGGVLCAEVIGLDPARVDEVLGGAASVLASVRPGLRGAIFLHAPYSVSSELQVAARRYAREHELLLATHLLESPDEVELLLRGRGPLAEGLAAVGLAALVVQAPDIRAIIVGQATAGTRLVHLASLPADQARYLPAGAIAVLCPRSNARLGVGPAPYAALRRAGVTLALGTDSLASSPDLDMRAEARAASEVFGISAREAVALATAGGAVALADPTLGRCDAGARADLVAVEDGGGSDPYAALLDPSSAVRAVVMGGVVRHQA